MFIIIYVTNNTQTKIRRSILKNLFSRPLIASQSYAHICVPTQKVVYNFFYFHHPFCFKSYLYYDARIFHIYIISMLHHTRKNVGKKNIKSPHTHTHLCAHIADIHKDKTFDICELLARMSTCAACQPLCRYIHTYV